MNVALQDLGRAVKRLQHRLHGRLDPAMAEIGTTLAQWDALRTIESSAGASGHVLATLTFQTDQSFGALISKLIKQRLIKRHPGVGRALFYTLTDQGRRVLTDGSRVVDDVLEEGFRELSTAERTKLFKLLLKVLSHGRPRDRKDPPNLSTRVHGA